jgi:hypothetical protein
MINAVMDAAFLVMPKPEVMLIPGVNGLWEFLRSECVHHPELGLNLRKGGNRSKVRTKVADECDGRVIMIPDAPHISLVGERIRLSTRGVLLCKEGKLLSVAGAEYQNVGLDHFVLQTLILGSMGLAKHDAAILCDALGPRSKVDLAIAGLGDWLLDDALTQTLNDTSVENPAVGLANVGGGLARLGEEHCTKPPWSAKCRANM